MENYIGIDLGGTNLRVARISEDFKVEEVIKVDSKISEGIDQLVQRMCVAINDVKNSDTKGVGLSVPGQVDVKTGVIIASTNIPFDNTPISDIIKKETGLDSVLNNDANVAGLAEAAIGAGKNSDIVYYITWSTGIGGALIIDKKIINGKNMYTGEIGNLIIHSQDTYKHSFMSLGGFEGLSSGTALKRYGQELGYTDAKGLIDAFVDGKEDAVKVIEYVTDNFARAIAQIFHVVEVDMFVIGGGVQINSGAILLPLVKAKIDNYIMPHIRGQVNLEVAKLGDNAGVYGSAFLVKDM